MSKKTLISGFLSNKKNNIANMKAIKPDTEKKMPKLDRELVSFSNYIYKDNLKWLKHTAIERDKRIVDLLNELIENAKK